MSTNIEWVRSADGSKGETWNPTTGCTKVSAGCKNCYAERMAHRIKRMGGKAGERYRNGFDLTLQPDKLGAPLRWRKPRTVFVNSMSDLFHRDVPDEYIAKVFGIAAMCPQHTFMILTKQPGRAADWFNWSSYNDEPGDAVREWLGECFDAEAGWHAYKRLEAMGGVFNEAQTGEYGRIEIAAHYDSVEMPWPLPNVWLGTSIEDQASADLRIPDLLQCPAAVHGVSAEPLLSGLNLRPWLPTKCCGSHGSADPRPMLGHVIAGCESGPGARPMDLDWARSLRDQCVAAGVPYFCKQADIGGRLVKMPELDGKVWDQMPEVPR